jgi:hypothetical protein
MSCVTYFGFSSRSHLPSILIIPSFTSFQNFTALIRIFLVFKDHFPCPCGLMFYFFQTVWVLFRSDLAMEQRIHVFSYACGLQSQVTPWHQFSHIKTSDSPVMWFRVGPY